jgi:hypothetical protein
MLDNEHVILGVFGLHEIAPAFRLPPTPSRRFFFDFGVYAEASAFDHQSAPHTSGWHSDHIKSRFHHDLKKDWRETEELRPGN